MTYKLQWIIIIASLLMTKVASATEFNINAIDKDQRGSVDLSLFKDQISVTPGSYFVTVAVNDIPLANGWQLRWREINNAVQVCIPPSWSIPLRCRMTFATLCLRKRDALISPPDPTSDLLLSKAARP